MLLSWNGVYESKELHKMEEMKEKKTKSKIETANNKNSGHFRNIRHKKKIMQVDPLIYYFYYILFFLSKWQ